ASKETYKLYPDVLKNNKGMEGFAANPDAKHYWNKDVFVYVTSWLESKADDTAKFVPMTMKVGDTAFYSNGLLILENVAVNPPDFKRAIANDETAMVLTIKTISKEGKTNTASPAVAVTPTSMRSLPDSVVGQGLVFQFNKVANQETKQLEIGIKENKQMTDLLTLKVLQFPFINVLWIGIVVMSSGFFMAMFSRLKRNKAAV
ncbi:MAG: cytochrome c assembly protein, partial [Bacteroidetes bacterium]